VRVTAHQFFSDPRQRGFHSESAFLLLHPRHHGYEQVEIAELLPQILVVVRIDCTDTFPDFLHEARAKRLRRLCPVPWTALGGSQAADDVEKSGKGGSRGI
jgi:hypothetical protein